MTDPWSSVPSRRRAELRRETFARYGRVCWLQLPGCTVLATEPDHVIPASRGGLHSVENLRPACRSCNASRQAGPTGRGEYGARVVVLLAQPGEPVPIPSESDAVVIDPERLALALTSDGALAGPAELPAIAAAAAAGARALAAGLDADVIVYVVERDEQRVAEHRERGSLVVAVAPSRDWSEPSSW